MPPGMRKPGQDHDYYQWSPITTRPVLKWPNNARVAVCAIINLEHYDWQVPDNLPQPVSPLGGPAGIPPRFPELANYGQHEYGNRVGVFRVLGLLDAYGIKPTVAMDKTTAENYPNLVKEIQKRGGEFIGHGTSGRKIIHSKMSMDEERTYIQESIRALANATGKGPIGWSGIDFQETVNTPNLLAAEGIRYVCDWSNDEQPYRMNVKQGELFSLGVNLDLDDVYIHLNGRKLIGEYTQIMQDEFDGLYHDGAKTGRVMVINLHPWVIGTPWRIKYLGQALEHMNTYGQVWKATGSEIVDWYKAQTK